VYASAIRNFCGIDFQLILSSVSSAAMPLDHFSPLEQNKFR
jgi:hypothetical protein